MTCALVTGANGFVGSNLIRKLLEEKVSVIAFHRKTSNTLNLDGLPIEHRYGDVRDRSSLREALRGCDTVFHTASVVSFWKQKRSEQIDINVGGTRNIVEACLEGNVARLIHTSSVAALGYRSDNNLIDESTPYNWGYSVGYKYSKHMAELEVIKGIKKGLNVVIVNPTVIIGPGDLFIHGGQLVRDIARRRIPAYSSGGMNVVGIHDVVQGHLAAAEIGRTGERYILGGHNMTHKETFKFIATILGKPAPFIKSPIVLTKTIARIFDIMGDVSGKQPWITSELISGLGRYNWYSIDKAARELEYSPTPLDAVVRETYEWYKTNGML